MDTLVATDVSGSASLTEAVNQILTLAGTVINVILANPVLALFFAGSFIGIVIAIVRKLKRI